MNGAQANMYRGTVTQTVTASESPLYQVGMVVERWYSYESDTLDGLFLGRDSRWLYPDEPMSLHGELFSFNGQGNLASNLPIGDTMGAHYNTKLNVIDGQVTNFNMDGENNGSDYWFYFDHFVCADLLTGRRVWGSLSFSDPVKEVTSVPEGLSTFYGLGVGLALIGVCRLFRVKPVAATVQSCGVYHLPR